MLRSYGGRLFVYVFIRLCSFAQQNDHFSCEENCYAPERPRRDHMSVEKNVDIKSTQDG